MLADRGWKLHRVFLPLLLVSLLLVIQMQSVLLGDSGSEARFNSHGTAYLGILVLVEIFLLNTAVFVPLGEQIGMVFEQLMRLSAYSWDLAGSLSGTLLFAVFSLSAFSPSVGFGIVLCLSLLITPRPWIKPTLIFACAIACLVITTQNPNAIWSRYHVITISNPWGTPVTEPEPRFRTRNDPLFTL